MKALPSLTPGDFTRLGSGLDRPEGVCVGPAGEVWASDARGLVALVDPTNDIARHGTGGVQPNGLALDREGRIIVADYGAGAVFRYDSSTSTTETLTTEVDGRPTTRPNFPALDTDGRIWCSNSTSLDDPRQAITQSADDGFVFVIEPDGTARIAAEGFRFANGIAFSPDGSWLYVAESGAQMVSRVPVDGGKVTGGIEVVTPRLGSIPDGVAFDAAGNLWITLVHVKNGLVLMTPEGELHTVIDDPSGNIGAPSNLAFGGDGRDLYLGNLALDCVLHARIDEPGLVILP